MVVKLLEEVKFMRSRKKDLLTEVHPLAFMDHVTQTNYTIIWDNIKLHMKEDTWITHGIKESISIRKP